MKSWQFEKIYTTTNLYTEKEEKKKATNQQCQE